MDRHYNNGPEGMPRVKRMTDSTLNCIIRDSLFSIFDSFEGEDRDRLYGLLHDTAEEVLARVPAWPATQPAEPAQGAVLTEELRKALKDAQTGHGSYGPNYDGNKLADSIRAILARHTAPTQPELTVWEGPMPESNGKSNFTAVLHRKGANGFDAFTDGFTIARSEYPDRVRYEADKVRWIIGERAERPELWDKGYDFDKHSGYKKPAAPQQPAAERVAVPEGLVLSLAERKTALAWLEAFKEHNFVMAEDEALAVRLAAVPSPQEGNAVRELAERLEVLGVTKFSLFPGSDPDATPDQVAAEVSGALDQLEGKAVEVGLLKCWSCKRPYTAEQRADADGNCPHCDVEIEQTSAQADTDPSPRSRASLFPTDQFAQPEAAALALKDGEPVNNSNEKEKA